MTDLAWMKVYIGTEAALTVHLSMEEFAAYERLRRHYWQHGRLPSEDQSKMARIIGGTTDQWDAIRSEICDLFAEGWRLPALDAEREDAAEKRAKAVERSHKAADARWSKNARSNATSNAASTPTSNARRTPEAMPEAMLEECPSASASDTVRYEEGKYSTPPVRARDDEADTSFPIPATDSEGRAWLRTQGLIPKQVERALPHLMTGRLTRVLLDQISLQ